APARQAGGHWFEPSTAHLRKPRLGGAFVFLEANRKCPVALSWPRNRGLLAHSASGVGHSVRWMATAEQWEYMLIDFRWHGFEERLNAAGSEGWEVVTYIGHDELASLVLKRPKHANGSPEPLADSG